MPPRPLAPPATSTRPLLSSVAVWPIRAALMAPVCDHVPEELPASAGAGAAAAAPMIDRVRRNVEYFMVHLLSIHLRKQAMCLFRRRAGGNESIGDQRGRNSIGERFSPGRAAPLRGGTRSSRRAACAT